MDPGTRLLTGTDGQRYEFDPGSFCLELLLTGGPEPFQHYEMLRTPADFVEWLLDSRLALAAPIVPQQVRVRLTELRDLKEFRDTMWAVASVIARGGRPDSDQLELINQCAELAVRPALDVATGDRRWALITGAHVLGTAARDAIEMIGGPVHRLRECAAEDCSLLFFDSSRPGSRRWCSMRRCGNRVKVKAYRGRHELAGARD